MRILILGGSGMLGHKLWQYFSQRFPDTFVTVRQSRACYEGSGLFNGDHVIDAVDVNDFSAVIDVLVRVRPTVILNCIGITKRREEASHAIPMITLNALFPHKLAEWGHNNAAKVINFSTDCVFNGEHGKYTEKSPTNAFDLYGRTKALGEIQGKNTLTIRSSFIGTELYAHTELFEWFLSQTGTVRGFKNAIYSGLTTLEICRIIEKILIYHPAAEGLYNISSDPISKFDLLMLIKDKLDVQVNILPDENMLCDRSLDSTKFRNEFKYSPPTWASMIQELRETMVKKQS